MQSVSQSRAAPRPSALIEARSKASSAAFAAEPREPLLYAALRAGVAVPYECATGTCGTCKARRIAGVVVGDWAQAPGNAYLRADRDEVLLCQTRALGNCAFEIPGNVNLASTARKLARLLNDFQFGAISDVLAQPPSSLQVAA